MSHLIDAIVGHIESNNIVDSNKLFVNYYPDEPDEIASVIASGGFPPKLYEPTRELTLEIKVRSTNYNDGMNICNNIFNLFHDKENYQLDSFFILRSYAYTEISYLYADSENRDEFSLDLAFLIQK
ncbi:minor capsid protein [Bacillus sp. SM2101]|uniref:minor capsid protein n=1 Tax=Bacillus sp. SM2101 TaxID=2805366 RepID=UPI001BDEC241|nr:minor capsid protein [Bacillus sp. SM2101]